MTLLNVDLGERSYPIHIAENLLASPATLAKLIASQQIMIVTNERIAPLYLAAVEKSFEDRQVANVILPDGEQFKTLETLNTIITALLENHFDRDCTLVALGGGVIGDMTGFAAATYQRGVQYVQVPTTLLAQVDSSVGGKTAVNHTLGKNMIGAFHQPAAVIADTATLKTLDDRELKAGLAEVVKYGLIRDANFFIWLEDNIDSLLNRNPAALAHAIARACENKAEVVAADEREVGIRASLNFGHTFGHAIETTLGYGRWLHGEAVAAGMCMAAALSAELGWLDESNVARIRQLMEHIGLPTWAPETLNAETLKTIMQVDKKNRSGKIRLVLLSAIGEVKITSDYDEAAFMRILKSKPSNF